MKRRQARTADGRFQRNTLRSVFGLASAICEGAPGAWCGGIITWRPGEEPPACHHCGAPVKKPQQGPKTA